MSFSSFGRLFNRIQEGETPGENPESEFLTSEDFEVGAPIGEGREQKDAIDEEVSNLVGMTKAKEWFAQVRQKVAFVEQTGTRSDLRVCLNIIITGNPGTGKTTFARLLARFFHTYGVLPKDSFVEKNGLGPIPLAGPLEVPRVLTCTQSECEVWS